MSLSLYRKYRPQTFSDVIGQKHIVQTLSNSIINDRVAHAYLFTGPRGTGKTTLARIFARAVNCKNPKDGNPCLECNICKNITQGRSLDIFEIDAASNTGVDNIRELRENVKFPPSHAKFKVYIIDEVHMLSTGAFNALLKTLEEPPAHVIFILATTEIHKVPETIISRCQRYDFTRLSLEHIIEKLSAIAESEKISIDKDAIEMIAVASEGGMRDAESLFAQVIAFEDKNITSAKVQDLLGTTKRQSLEALAKNIFDKNATEAIALINQLSQDGYDLDVFNKSFLNYLRQIMLVSVDEKLSKLFSFELTTEQTNDLLFQAKGKVAKEILFVVQCFTEIQGKIKSAFIPQLPLEMAIIKAVGGQQTAVQNQPQTSKSANFPSPAPIVSPITATPTVSEPPKATQTPENAHSLTQEPESSPIAPPIEKPIPEVNIETAKITKPEAIKNEAQIADSEFTLVDVKKHWNQFIKDTKRLNHSIAAVLQNSQPVSAEYGIITIATAFPFHKDKLNENANKLTIEGVFANILGLRVLIKVVTTQEAGITIASSLRQQQSNNHTETPPSETSSLLSNAMNILGGNLVE
ncbi:MAG: DNA polymerase III subunit gamma/tau [Candidatus Moranbacteria bacterium]|nr:DNA polymerase III subunit gamma/tau [Candidatus Moranbacteria bacterium]